MILAVLAGLLLAAALLLIVPVLVLLVQIVSARGAAAATSDAAVRRPSVAVLMPAHDEAVGIAAAITAVRAQLLPGDRLLVVADNCGDDTAQVASAGGAEVSERTDAVLRGKGYALDHGVRHLAAAPPEVVIVVDADCIVAAGGIDRLARECGRAARPVQALYRMTAPPEAPLRQRMAQFAWAVRNDLRPLGWGRLGLPCQLMGTGMAFPWLLIAAAPLASASIVEDMQLGLELAAAGSPPRFCHAALVTSSFPATAEGALEQRTRWEHGHLAMIATRGLPLLWRGIVAGRPALAAMALDLCVPPLAALVLLLTALTVAGALLAFAGGDVAPFAVALLALALTTAAVVLAWRRVGRQSVSAREMLSIPGYVFAKIPIYVRLFTARQMQWIRTRRDGGDR
jgi:cellulose synthase/poly-beta-1,6-N-acetylglucosamine synthase-like glycosyltransferase